MPNVKIVLEYNGANFHGWQFQPELRTIEADLLRVLSLVLREKISVVYGSGRTDAGVHARGQVANFYCKQPPDLSRLCKAASSILRGDLSILSAEIVDDSFNSRKSAHAKQYSYHILHRDSPPTFERGVVWHLTTELDIQRMQREAASLVGIHDFTSLRAANCSAPSPIKEILESELLVDDDRIVYRVVGKGFLKQMVRNIVGTLVAIGKGRLSESMLEIIELHDRRRAGVTAPPQGLFLDWVQY